MHLHIVPFIIIILITVILIVVVVVVVVVVVLFEMLFLFSVNPILSFSSFESKKSVLVDMVIAAKHLEVASRIYLLNNVFFSGSITNNESCCKF